MNGVPQFIIFGTAHIMSIIVVLVSIIVLPLLLRRVSFNCKIRIGTTLAVIIILNEIFTVYISTNIYGNPLSRSLPFHLCGFAALLTAWMLYQHSYRAYEVAYFWSVGGSIPAIITPDLLVGFPHPSFIHFFAAHGLILLGAIYATMVFEFRPTLGSVAKAVGATLVLMFVIAAINTLLDVNYMYLCEKPLQITAMEFMGPWPWYILSLIVIGILLMLLSYLPFVFLRKKNI
jgi:hypothetical integral membrane protein (TIGR02206 family)